jgi:sortase A
MGVPANPWDVAWLNVNPRPGEIGNAVIDGHLDTATDTAVFWNLNQLKPGDLVYVTDSDGRSLTFAVVDKQAYTDATAPLDRIFGTASDRNLNLITCAGTWHPAQQAYDQRLVVYTHLVSPGG